VSEELVGKGDDELEGADEDDLGEDLGTGDQALMLRVERVSSKSSRRAQPRLAKRAEGGAEQGATPLLQLRQSSERTERCTAPSSEPVSAPAAT
jgi:hypothetical protein